MQQGLCNGTVSIRLSVNCLSHSPTAAACGGFAAVGPETSIDRGGAAAVRRLAANAGSVTFTAKGRG